MKRIAYPLYDVVFKYLMEDLEVARRLISAVIGREILHIETRAQEHAYALEKHPTLTVYRLDFAATVRTAEGQIHQVAIEVQKSKDVPDILRFRRYLGEHYARASSGEGAAKTALPIISIYIVGFDLQSEHAIVHAVKEFRDAVTGEEVEMRAEFVQLLTHESYFIQASLLPTRTRSKVERLLSVFSRKWAHDEAHNWIIEFDESEGGEDEDLRLVLRRLELAIADSEVRQRILAVEEAEREYEQWMKQKDETIEQQAQELKEKTAALRRSIALLRRAGLGDAEIAAELGIAPDQLDR